MTGAWTFVRHAVAATLAALAVAVSGPADAIDVRSWDQTINDANRRFVVLSAFGDQAVLDKETQLVWQRVLATHNADIYGVWHDDCGRLRLGGRGGWRLPTLPEMTSLIDPAVVGTPKLPAGHPFEPLLPGTTLSGVLFTSTENRLQAHSPEVPTSRRFYGVSLDTGAVTVVALGFPGGIAMCVRGPASGYDQQ